MALRLLLVAGAVAHGAPASAPRGAPTNYTVLPNTDFFGFNAGSKITDSFELCAQACWTSPTCVAVSWNGPASKYKDKNCNMHCSAQGKRSDKGEVGAVIRKGAVNCPAPAPGPPAPTPGPTAPIPQSWAVREQEANMYIAGEEPLVVGNGFVAAMTRTGVMHVAGVFNGDLDLGKENVRADIPSFWDNLLIDGYLGDFASALDVGVSAVYSVGALRGGGTLEARRYAHRSMAHVVGVDFFFNNTAGSAALLSNISQPASWGQTSNANLTTKDSTWAPASALINDDDDAGMACWSGSVPIPEDASLPMIHLGLCGTDLRSSPLLVSVPAGQTKTYSVLAAIYTTQDHSSPVVAAAADLKAAQALTVSARWDAHLTAVNEVLESGIEVAGNHDLAKLINASFHTLVAALRQEPEFWYSSSPGGLATSCYNGHTFWDMETWMYPNLLFFHPNLAHGTVMYRVRGLPWAEKYARDTGRAGARYPWQTAASGKIASLANANEIHIVGDVALSMWQYYAATHNSTWLKEHGLPNLRATAAFFAGWAASNADGTYSLNGTQGPDEFHSGDDSCYVNAAARLNLRTAANFSTTYGLETPANWTKIADNVRLPFDSARQMHLEYAEWTDTMKAKQADTIMLSYPLGVEMPVDVRRNDLNYYANHTGNGPSMTWSMYAVGYLEIGDMDRAEEFFNKSWLPYVDYKTGDFGGDCGGNFLTGAGGFLQGLWAGWAGIRLRENSLDFLTPRVPATTTGLKLRGISYLGHKFNVDLSDASQKACFRAWPTSAKPQQSNGGVDVATGLKISTLDSNSFAPLSADVDTCYPVGTSVRIVAN